jgi:hypothetical protein
MPAERTGVIKGDIILAFGTLSPAEVIENREAMAGLKRHDWLLIQRGTTVFKLAFGEGLEGCLMEAHARVEVDLPTGVDYPTWWGGVQSGGAMVLIPDKISKPTYPQVYFAGHGLGHHPYCGKERHGCHANRLVKLRHLGFGPARERLRCQAAHFRAIKRALVHPVAALPGEKRPNSLPGSALPARVCGECAQSEAALKLCRPFVQKLGSLAKRGLPYQ